MDNTHKDKEIANKLNEFDYIPEELNWSEDSGWKAYKAKYRKGKTRKLRYWWYAGAAALLLIALILVFPGKKNKKVHWSSGDRKKQVVLNDGSVFWLNKNTQLTVNYSDELIEIEGEIYAKLSGENSYQIQTPNGTFFSGDGQFNLCSRKDKKRSVLVVASGAVHAIWDEKRNLKSVIKEGIQAEIIPEVALVQAPVEDPNYLAWKTGKLQFNNTPFYFIVKKLEHLNNIQIQIQDESIRYCRLNSTFHSIQADSVLNKIESDLNVKITKNENQYVISGKGCQ